MKRCPKCEFIYEDDQSLCDMDGVLLVLDSRNLPSLHALATVPPAPERVQARRNRAVPAFATLILALILGMVYYVSTQRSVPQDAFTPPAAASTSNTVPEVTPEPPALPPSTEASQAPPAAEPKREPSKKPAAAPATKPVKAVSGTTTKPSDEPKKDDSKVGSILKKTGRILKKPFKF